MDRDVCEFVVNRPLLPDWAAVFHSAEEGKDSPIVDAVFAVEGIASVTIQDSTLTIKKADPRDWPVLARELIPHLKAAFAAEKPVISPQVLADLRELPSGGSMREIIESVLQESINPALGSHGGWVKLRDIVDRDVYLELGGGCQGCSASQVTMKQGIETAIRQACPQVREVIDATDHDAGETPYFS